MQTTMRRNRREVLLNRGKESIYWFVPIKLWVRYCLSKVDFNLFLAAVKTALDWAVPITPPLDVGCLPDAL